MKYIYYFLFSEDSVRDILYLMDYDLFYCSQLELSDRNIMVTNTWNEIMMLFREWNLDQTVGLLLLFRGSNYIEYVDCDIEGYDGVIFKAESVVSTNDNISLLLLSKQKIT